MAESGKVRTVRLVLALSVFGADGFDSQRMLNWIVNAPQLIPDPDALINLGAGIKVTVLVVDSEETT